MSELKESYPVDVAIYARAQGIDDKPAFKWWVPHTLKKMGSIIKSVKASMAKKNMKYGVRVPRSYKQAREFDAEEDNGGLWEKAYRKEMKNVGIAFEILDEGKTAPVGWKKSSVHLIFKRTSHFQCEGEGQTQGQTGERRTPYPRSYHQ